MNRDGNGSTTSESDGEYLRNSKSERERPIVEMKLLSDMDFATDQQNIAQLFIKLEFERPVLSSRRLAFARGEIGDVPHLFKRPVQPPVHRALAHKLTPLALQFIQCIKKIF